MDSQRNQLVIALQHDEKTSICPFIRECSVGKSPLHAAFWPNPCDGVEMAWDECPWFKNECLKVVQCFEEVR